MDGYPYCGPAPRPADLLWSWNGDLFLLLALAIATSVGLFALRHAGHARRRSFTFAIGAAFIAFVSPLCALTVALFSARALHHLVVFGLLAPALALAFPVRRIAVAPSFLAMSAGLWLWYLPLAYSAAWDSVATYWAMQALLILPAWAFWSAVLTERKFAHVVWLVPLVGQMGILGAILTFAGRPFYLEHLAYAERYGLTALQDQQLAGLVMWVPGMLPVAIAAALMAWRLLDVDARA